MRSQCYDFHQLSRSTSRTKVIHTSVNAPKISADNLQWDLEQRSHSRWARRWDQRALQCAQLVLGHERWASVQLDDSRWNCQEFKGTELDGLSGELIGSLHLLRISVLSTNRFCYSRKMIKSTTHQQETSSSAKYSKFGIRHPTQFAWVSVFSSSWRIPKKR